MPIISFIRQTHVENLSHLSHGTTEPSYGAVNEVTLSGRRKGALAANIPKSWIYVIEGVHDDSLLLLMVMAFGIVAGVVIPGP